MKIDDNVLRKRVQAQTAQGVPKAEGRVVAYCDAPQVLIETDDGERLWWRADLCEEANEKAPA